MSSKKLKQLVLLNGIIVIINIVLFSKMFLGFSLFSGSALTIALGWTSVIVSICIFVAGNLRILRREETRSLTKSINNLNDCISVLEESRWIKTFAQKINENIEQIKRFKKKQITINDILLQKFSSDEITYKHFAAVLQEVENAVYINVRSILNKISAFDESEYKRIASQRQISPKSMHSRENRSSYGNSNVLENGGVRGNREDSQKDLSLSVEELNQEKMRIYNEYISFVNHATHDNEQILLKLDKMLLEISRYNSLEDGDIDNMPAIKEMDELIKNAKLYK